MTIARRLLVPQGVSRCYHCISRCVRRARLCDDQTAHRKDWIKRRLVELERIFAIEVGGFAIMGNHLHLLVRTQPDQAARWSDEQVARRWIALYPRLAEQVRQASGAASEQQLIRILLAGNRQRVPSWRERLASLSWFMKCLKEPIARRANREDDVTGHFWEGRFKVQSLLDEAAVLACMVYIDLNPIRAHVATTPEGSDYTSVQDRIHVRQLHRKAQGLRARAPQRAAALTTLPAGNAPAHAEDGIWLIPIERRRHARGTRARAGLLGLTLDDYLQLVDLTGRHARASTSGTIPEALEPILSRLSLDVECWLREMLGHGRRIGTAIGSAASLAEEALRRGTRWVVNACRVYREPVGQT